MSNSGRRSIRLPGYDYSQPGGYFITINSYQRRPLFSEVIRGEVILTIEGRVVEDEWFRTQDIRPEVVLNTFVIMPTHFHGIIFIGEQVRAHGYAPVLIPGQTPRLGRQPRSLGALVARFKGSVTRRARKMSDDPLLKVWQRNYYEPVIRNEQQLNAIRRYITDNPLRWKPRP